MADMLEFEVTWKDLVNLGYPMELKKKMYREYYRQVNEENINPLDFKATIPWELSKAKPYITFGMTKG